MASRARLFHELPALPVEEKDTDTHSPPPPVSQLSSPNEKRTTTSTVVAVSPISRPDSSHSIVKEKLRLSQDPGLYACTYQPGLEVFAVEERDKFYNSPYADGSKTLEVNDGSIPPPSQQQDTRPRRTWRFWLIVFIPVFVILLLIIVLSAVFGTRAAKARADAAAQASSTSIPGPPGPFSMKSTRGAWNGTGMMLLPSFGAIDGWYQYLLAYQSFDSSVHMVPINVSATATSVSQSSVKVGSPFSLGIQIANGTGMTGHTGIATESGPEAYQIIYVSPNGTLSDISSSQANIFQWTPGNLSTLGHKAPIDRRTQMRFDWNRCFGMSTNKSGERLWAPGQDGKMHQYNYDWSVYPWNWTKDDTVVPGSNGDGAFTWVQMQQASDSCNSQWNLLNSDDKGNLLYQAGSINSNNNDTEWPTGPTWSAPQPAPGNVVLTSGSNVSSEVAAWPKWDTGDLRVFYEKQGGLQELTVRNSFRAPPVYTQQQYPGIAVMPGTAMSVGWSWVNQSGGPLMVVYQRNGTSLDWWLTDTLSQQQASGNILS